MERHTDDREVIDICNLAYSYYSLYTWKTLKEATLGPDKMYLFQEKAVLGQNILSSLEMFQTLLPFSQKLQ